MYFFLSNDYTEPSVLINDPRVLEDDLLSLEGSLALCEKQKERLRNAPKSLAEELLLRIQKAESEHEALLAAYNERKEECKEALAQLGIPFEGRRTH